MEAASNQDIVKTVHVNGVAITLVGTAHVSQKSVDLVEEKIRTGLVEDAADPFAETYDLWPVVEKATGELIGMVLCPRCDSDSR